MKCLVQTGGDANIALHLQDSMKNLLQSCDYVINIHGFYDKYFCVVYL